MSGQINYQILLQEAVKTAIEAAERAKNKKDTVAAFAYYDILDTIKTQAEVMAVPLDEIGLAGIDLDRFVKAEKQAA